MSLRVCLAGATGWAGSELARGIAKSPDLTLVAAISRTHAGRVLGDVLGEPSLDCRVHASAADALSEPCDVFVEYTRPESAKVHVLTALAHGAHVVVGTSGLTGADYAEIDAAARAAGRGVIAAGNFSVLAATLLHAATLAAQHVSHWEVLDYASAGKPDVPSGTARELAERLGAAAPADHDADLVGPPGARGADVAGTRVHSLRLPGYVLSTQVILAAAGERLALHHEAGTSAEPYVAGTLLAIRRVGTVTGLQRGLDRLLFG